MPCEFERNYYDLQDALVAHAIWTQIRERKSSGIKWNSVGVWFGLLCAGSVIAAVQARRRSISRIFAGRWIRWRCSSRLTPFPPC